MLDVIQEAARTYSLPPSQVQLACGVPLKELEMRAIQQADAASSHGIKAGVIVDVRRAAQSVPGPVAAAQHVPEPATAAGGGSAAPAVTDPGAAGQHPNGAWSCSACTFLSENAAAVGCEMCGTERPPPLSRHVVPADNTCLFTAVGYGMEQDMGRGPHYREKVATAIANNAAQLELTEAELGKSPQDYGTYIGNANTWGGGIELAVLSRLLRLEICAIEIRTSRPYTFGEGRGYQSRLYLVFDGIHYDVLHRRAPDGAVTTLFTVEAGEARASALALAAHLRKSREFVDLTSFTLRCGTCYVGLKGEVEAQAHARSTGHTNFSEYA